MLPLSRPGKVIEKNKVKANDEDAEEREYPTGNDKGYDVVVDNQDYIEEMLHGKGTFNRFSMEEIYDLIGYNSFGARWTEVKISPDKKQISATGAFNNESINITVVRNDGQQFQDYELSWIPKMRY